jgi:hypothetical protein
LLNSAALQHLRTSHHSMESVADALAAELEEEEQAAAAGRGEAALGGAVAGRAEAALGESAAAGCGDSLLRCSSLTSRASTASEAMSVRPSLTDGPASGEACEALGFEGSRSADLSVSGAWFPGDWASLSLSLSLSLRSFIKLNGGLP